MADIRVMAGRREIAVTGAGSGSGATRKIADGLCLAAAPSFASMALLTAVFDVGDMDPLCSAAGDASPLSGMVAMYLLMSLFHSASWMRLIARRRGGAERP
jgi:hypothetical protein